MTDVEWERERAAQNAYLSAQLLALGKRPFHRRKQFIQHEIRCSGCGDLLVQVLTLDPYRVVRHRGTAPDQSEFPADMDPKQRALEMAMRQRSIRLEKDWMFFPIGDDEPRADADSSFVLSTCRCTQAHRFTLRDILERPGRKSTSRPTRPD